MGSNTRKILLLSPHADDVALSLGGWLAFLRHHKMELLKEIEVFTGFTWSNVTPHMPEVTGNSVKATMLRKEEELAFCDSFNLLLSVGMLPDTSILNINYTDPVDIITDQRLVLLKDMLRDRIAGKTVFAPISLGDHVDHRIFTRVAMESKDQVEIMIFYEDLPYATWYGDEERNSIIAQKIGESALPFVCLLSERESRLKRESLEYYKSQLNDAEIEVTMNYQCTGNDERFETVWVISPSDLQIKLLREMGFISAKSKNSSFLD